MSMDYEVVWNGGQLLPPRDQYPDRLSAAEEDARVVTKRRKAREYDQKQRARIVAERRAAGWRETVCLCGCGELVPISASRSARRPSRFKRGHGGQFRGARRIQ